MDLDAITVLAFETFGTRRLHPLREPGYTFYHGQRVGRLAVQLRKELFPNQTGDDDVLYVAGLFHDSTKGTEPHNETGAALVQQLLRDYCSASQIEQIAEIIRFHNRRGSSDNSLVKIVQDADILDHEGVQGVWLLFTVSAALGQSIPHALHYDHDHPPTKKRKRALNYPLSRKIYAKRLRFYQTVLKRLDREANGDFF